MNEPLDSDKGSEMIIPFLKVLLASQKEPQKNSYYFKI